MPDQREVLLDLDKVDLYGWETHKSAQTIAALVRGINAGDEFKPVPVQKRNDKEYDLAPNSDIDQGFGRHNRALAHYICGVPLRIVITN
ncbi:hypothetical protein HYX16_01880 [Candidatus Woesearchaeota archaeon]|nr:hypothetical protein [Candidatus Woesearchaeota archaeon]